MNFWLFGLEIIGILRFICVLFLGLYPIPAYLFCSFLDIIDGQVAYEADLSWRQYSTYDKLLDYWLYVGIILYSYRLEIFPIILILFVIRSIGQIIFLVTNKDKYLFWFPNILERFFVLYLIVGGHEIILLIIAVLITIPHEYIFHIRSSHHAGRTWSPAVKSEGRFIKKII